MTTLRCGKQSHETKILSVKERKGGREGGRERCVSSVRPSRTEYVARVEGEKRKEERERREGEKEGRRKGRQRIKMGSEVMSFGFTPILLFF